MEWTFKKNNVTLSKMFVSLNFRLLTLLDLVTFYICKVCFYPAPYPIKILFQVITCSIRLYLHKIPKAASLFCSIYVKVQLSVLSS